MALMSLRTRSHIKASVVLTIADHLFILNYIRSLLNTIVIPVLMVPTDNPHNPHMLGGLTVALWL